MGASRREGREEGREGEWERAGGQDERRGERRRGEGEEGREGEWERARGQEERRGERRRGDGEEGREGEGGGRERAETHTERDTRGIGERRDTHREGHTRDRSTLRARESVLYTPHLASFSVPCPGCDLYRSYVMPAVVNKRARGFEFAKKCKWVYGVSLLYVWCYDFGASILRSMRYIILSGSRPTNENRHSNENIFEVHQYSTLRSISTAY